MYTDPNGNPIGNVMTDQAVNGGLQPTPGGERDMPARILIELQVIAHLLHEQSGCREELAELRNSVARSLFTAVGG